MSLVLASGSRSRKKLLEDAGIACRAHPASVDEAALRDRMSAAGATFQDIAEALAREKAVQVSRKYPGQYVLGGDQLLICDGRLFAKAHNLDQARRHLKFFRGRTHYLYTSLVLVKDDEEIWRTTVTPELTMRDFSDDFLEHYLEKTGEAILSSVGCYFLEEQGAQLFAEIKGDYFSILGLPLLPLMEILRQKGVLRR
tara:strand:- start:15647 stop:16240 length:594 start_codon:yes stop_codon:yes gene_type:complete